MSDINIEEVKNNPCTRGWLKRAITDMEQHDCVDMAIDAEVFAIIAKQRMRAIFNKNK